MSTNKLYIQRFEDLPQAEIRNLNDDSSAAKYLTDESRLEGHAEWIAFPRSAEEAASVLKTAHASAISVTVSGARTGITAGAVPSQGVVLNLENMDAITGVYKENDVFCIQCQSGVVLQDLHKAVRTGSFAQASHWSKDAKACLEEMKQHSLFYPPDPTETTATVGGTIACNASGAHTFRYGPTRSYVAALRVLLANGDYISLHRGCCFADDQGRFCLVHPDGTEKTVSLPNYSQPSTKNVAGYYAAPGMDLIDLFIGSEGTLGVIVDADLRVIEAPEHSFAVTTFWPTEEKAAAFTQQVRSEKQRFSVDALEYFDPHSLQLLRRRRDALGPASGVPGCLPKGADAAVHLDLSPGTSGEYAVLKGIADKITEAGGNPEHCWYADERTDRERFRIFRHALPEAVNERISDIRKQEPEVTKLGTDMAVPDDYLLPCLQTYRKKLETAELNYVIFGHIGDNHLHVNILPQTRHEYDRGKEIYREIAYAVVQMGGSVAAEHGIGKLKKEFLKIMVGYDVIKQMQDVKRAFDRNMLLGRGTLFEAEQKQRESRSPDCTNRT